ncbi:hypothetical protein FNV43_RR03002 [Rhamnella rubrinervis]|uniref:Uncharacterized protein n=1 Tax=Rhamnella rubrinervis TaxID=2594499 RepID=A0A8K0MNM5_9ROSA|nr:hypothetical protein FNV43_RR03002 [Rhamnella rubrinervis]
MVPFPQRPSGGTLCNSDRPGNAHWNSSWHTPDAMAPKELVQLHINPYIICLLSKPPDLLYGLGAFLLKNKEQDQSSPIKSTCKQCKFKEFHEKIKCNAFQYDCGSIFA